MTQTQITTIQRILRPAPTTTNRGAKAIGIKPDPPPLAAGSTANKKPARASNTSGFAL